MLSSLICGILLSLEHVWPSPDMLKRIIDMPLHVLESRQSLNQVSMIAIKRYAIRKRYAIIGLFLINLIINMILSTENRGFLYSVFCAGGINDEDPWNEKDNRENAIMAFFRDYFAVGLNKPFVKGLVLCIFVGYLGVSGWAVSSLREGLERKRLSRYDSYSVDFYNMEDQYFREYPYRVNVSH